MQNRTLKSTQIGEITISETAEGNTVKISIGDKSANLTRNDFAELEAVKNEFFTKELFVECSICGHEVECLLETSEKTARIKVNHCQVCGGKELNHHENT